VWQIQTRPVLIILSYVRSSVFDSGRCSLKDDLMNTEESALFYGTAIGLYASFRRNPMGCRINIVILVYLEYARCTVHNRGGDHQLLV